MSPRISSPARDGGGMCNFFFSLQEIAFTGVNCDWICDDKSEGSKQALYIFENLHLFYIDKYVLKSSLGSKSVTV